MRTYYGGYANYCARYYVRHSSPHLRTDAEKKNWNACENTFKSFSDSDRDILVNIYRDGGDSLSESFVNQTAQSNHMRGNEVWGLISEFQNRFAKKRGLI